MFPKGLTHGLGPKMSIFPTFFLSNIGQKNVFYGILKQKNAFLGFKIKKFKKSKNWHFFKAVNPRFWSKNGHFSNFFFTQYRPGKCTLWYSRTKKRFSRLKKTRSSKSPEIGIFPEGLTHCFWSKNGHFSNFCF